jgi:hypothetical protein
MKKQPQQPSMDEWLLDPIHGLEAGDEDNISQAITPTDFLTPEAFDYFSTIQPKRSTNNIERQVRRLISRSIWPRILIARCRLLLSTAIPLMINGHWDMVEQVLTFVRTALHYLGFFIHGLRLLMNMAHLVQTVISSDSAIAELQQQLMHSWFEMFTDTQWIISALIPSNYLEVSCALMFLELVFIAIRSLLEAQRISHCIKKIDDTINQQDLKPEQLDELMRVKTHAEEMLQHTYKKLALNFGVTALSTCLFVFRNVLLPAMVVSVANPLIPFVFAAIALLISVANHYLSQYFDQQKPKLIKQNPSDRHLFFRENQQLITTWANYEKNNMLQ